MKRLLLFNCSNDMALSLDCRQYFPPKQIMRMEDDLSVLPIWWADDGDAVIVTDVNEAYAFVDSYREFLSSNGICASSGILPDVVFTDWNEGYHKLSQRTGCEFVPSPWGWSRAVAERFRRFGVPGELMPADSALSLWRNFSSREFAVGYIREFIGEAEKDEWGNGLVGRRMKFCKSAKEVCDTDWDSAKQLIFKPLWSSSGRGIMVSDVSLGNKTVERLSSLSRMHGGFLADVLYDKLLDFAMEFEIRSDGTAEYTGLSVFDAAADGRYGGNFVEPDECLRSRVSGHIGVQAFDRLLKLHARLLSERLGGNYAGPVGIDMIVAKKEGRTVVHPCIEINLRMNMGILSNHLFRRFSAFSNAFVREDGTNGSVVNLYSPISIPLVPTRMSGFSARLTAGRFMLSSS